MAMASTLYLLLLASLAPVLLSFRHTVTPAGAMASVTGSMAQQDAQNDEGLAANETQRQERVTVEPWPKAREVLAGHQNSWPQAVTEVPLPQAISDNEVPLAPRKQMSDYAGRDPNAVAGTLGSGKYRKRDIVAVAVVAGITVLMVGCMVCVCRRGSKWSDNAEDDRETDGGRASKQSTQASSKKSTSSGLSTLTKEYIQSNVSSDKLATGPARAETVDAKGRNAKTRPRPSAGDRSPKANQYHAYSKTKQGGKESKPCHQTDSGSESSTATS